MKIGIMQPYLFPYCGYFSLIKYCDRFVFFDTPQYISHGWMNRNRILRQDGKAGYFIIPIRKRSRETAIKDIKVSECQAWRETFFGQLTVYKRKAPNYSDVTDFLHNILDKDFGESLAKINIASVIETCNYLGIYRDFDVFSEMNLDMEKAGAADEWALNISKSLKGDIYVNLPGGIKFFDKKKYESQGIRLEFLRSNLRPYVQRTGHFEPGLSIIDMMMFCSKEEIADILDDFEIIG